MKTVFHSADSRGDANHGWLKSKHTFSFGEYYDTNRMGFGALRVINDDTVAGGKGFGKHSHHDMEIISIVLSGKLKHSDSMGNQGIIEKGDIQVMSAGTGITHSEMNGDDQAVVQFLQIWVKPKQQNVTPRYQQLPLTPLVTANQFNQILSPDADTAGVWIHQNAWFNLGEFEQNALARYTLNDRNNGVYIFVISGKVSVNGQELDTRDGLAIWETPNFEVNILQNASVLLMEVPL